MADEKRPLGREKEVTGAGKGVHKRGEGLGTGKVGSGGVPGGPQKPSNNQQSSSGRGSGTRAGGGMGKLLIIAAVLLLGGGGGLGSMLGLFGGGNSAPATAPSSSYTAPAPTAAVSALQSLSGLSQVSNMFSGGSGNSSLSALSMLSGNSSANSALSLLSGSGSSGSSGGSALSQLSGGSSGSSGSSSGSSSGNYSYSSLLAPTASVAGSAWRLDSNNGMLDRSVAPGARSKFTKIKGSGKDSVTIMVYMCGTDLESRSSMATRDLQEMASASLSDKVNIIVYTGGCSKWQINGISNKVNQIYRVKQGSMELLEKDMGSGAMTDPATLETFLKYCKKNYSSDRMMLIFWDHGGGSLQGYGYDETHKTAGSMNLGQINKALKAGGMKYDFIGFDACLMATTETALMLSEYADYMIASEETEPGVGWYYTNWLNDLSKNTSTPTLDIGKKICDDFVDVCGTQCRGQKTTLSVVDLSELSATLGDAFSAFSADTREMIANDEYKKVSSARSNTREFSGSSSIDQIDLIHFAGNLGTKESQKLADTLLSAVKYNRTGNMSNAYGLSIYFPYRTRPNTVNTANNIYDSIGLDDEYSSCIKEFASLSASGQAVSSQNYYGGGSASPLSLLSGLGNSSGSSSSSGADAMMQMLNLFMNSQSGSGLFTGRSMSLEDTVEYISENQFDPSKLVWEKYEDNVTRLVLSQDQWDLVQDLDLNMYYDDGEGYIDLGLDNVFAFDDYGHLTTEAVDGSWVSINDQPVAYYRQSSAVDDGHYTITGRVPALLNDQRVDLILIFSDETPKGYIAGALPVYDEEETETVARGLVDLEVGDKLDFICDYYDYNGNYQDSYFLGDQMEVTDNMVISNTYVGGDYLALYKFTDIYAQSYWSDPVPAK